MGPQSTIEARLSIPSFALEKLPKYLDSVPRMDGVARLDVNISGRVDAPVLSGEVEVQDLKYQGQKLHRLSADFLRREELVYLTSISALSEAGKVNGEGWVFLGDKPRVLFDLQGQELDPNSLMPGIASTANFDVKLLGNLEEPLAYGHGDLSNLGEWGQGAHSAEGRFMVTKREALVYEGSVGIGSSLMSVSLASLDFATRQFDGIVSAQNFSTNDVPGLSGVSGRFSGSAMVSADLSQASPKVTAQARLTEGTFQSQGVQVEKAAGEFYYDGYQMVSPDFRGTVAGDVYEGSGVYDLRTQGVDLSVESPSLSLGKLGLPGQTARFQGSVTGALGGTLGLYGYANSKSLGEVAVSGFRRPNGEVSAVAWVDAENQGVDFKGTLVANGQPSNLDLDYTGELRSEQVAELGELDVFGSANLRGKALTIRPTLLRAADKKASLVQYPITTYRGSALPLFGPLLSGPLEKLVIEESPFPVNRTMMLSGGADLERRSLDVAFDIRGAGLEEFADRWTPVGQEALDHQLPAKLLGAYGTARGRAVGRMGSPQISADFHLPWLFLENEPMKRQSLSVSGRLREIRRGLNIESLTISEKAFDARVRPGQTLASGDDAGILKATGHVSNDGQVELRMTTSDFALDALSFFVDSGAREFIPFGRVATNNLHIWGTTSKPSVAGEIEFKRGGVMLAGEPFPIQEGRLDLASQGGEVRVKELRVSAQGIEMAGWGRRQVNGQVEGELYAKDVEFSDFHRLGRPFTGFEGEADVLLELGGSLPSAPVLKLGVATRNLTWDPVAVGGNPGAIKIQELALGRIDPEKSRLLSGLTLARDNKGLYFDFADQGFRFKTESTKGMGLTLSGAVRLDGFPQLKGKTFSAWLNYLASEVGPDFGSGGKAFVAQAENWTFRELSRLMGQSAPRFHFQSNATVSLEGQWWRDHALDAGSGLPRYSLALDSLRLSGGDGTNRSGFALASPAELVYQREGQVGYASTDGLSFEFFGTPKETVEPAEEGLEAPITLAQQGTLDLGFKLALATVPGQKVDSEFNMAAVELPLDNLAFLFGEQLGLGGVIETLEVNMDGVLPEPKLSVQGVVRKLSLGELDNMTLQGDVRGSKTESGYLLSLDGKEGRGIALTFGDNDPTAHRVSAGGTSTFFWESEAVEDPQRLELIGRRLTLSLQSPIALSASVIDQDLKVLSDFVPGKETTSGTFVGDLAVTGTLLRPEFEGQLKLEDGRFDSRKFGKFENLNLDATIERIAREVATDTAALRDASSGFITRFLIKTAEGTLGGQPFFADGKAEFAGIAPTFLGMFVVGEALPLRVPGLFTGRVDLDFELAGTEIRSEEGVALKPRVKGTVVIPRGDFDVPLGGGTENLEKTPRVPLDVDIDLELGKEFYVRAMDSSIRAKGALNIRTEGEQAKIYGDIDLSRGAIRIPFYDASFLVRQGVARFDGPAIPKLESVEAVADLGEYRITATVEGRYPDSLNVNLFSDPPLPQAELSRLVVLGGLPGASSSSNEATSSSGTLGLLSGQGVSFLSGVLTNRLAEEVGRLFFLSEVSFDYIPPATYAIKVAKALDTNDNFLVTLTRIIRESGLNENLFGIEWRFARNLLVRGAFDQFARPRFWFQSINRF